MATHFDNYAQAGNAFLKKVAGELGSPDLNHAFRVVQAVFYALRDRITPEESMHLISELPMALKAVYVNNWEIPDKPEKYETKAEFLGEVHRSIITADVDFGTSAEDEVQAVFRVLKNYISEGEINHVKGQLPREIAELIDV